MFSVYVKIEETQKLNCHLVIHNGELSILGLLYNLVGALIIYSLERKIRNTFTESFRFRALMVSVANFI